MTANEHITEAQRLLTQVDEHLDKRARKFGTDQLHLVAHATAHATVAIALQQQEPSHQR